MRDIDETWGENGLLLSIGTDEENNRNEVTLIRNIKYTITPNA